jgi:hypothetical protein
MSLNLYDKEYLSRRGSVNGSFMGSIN